jgi:hypothetical protein
MDPTETTDVNGAQIGARPSRWPPGAQRLGHWLRIEGLP